MTHHSNSSIQDSFQSFFSCMLKLAGKEDEYICLKSTQIVVNFILHTPYNQTPLADLFRVLMSRIRTSTDAVVDLCIQYLMGILGTVEYRQEFLQLESDIHGVQT